MRAPLSIDRYLDTVYLERGLSELTLTAYRRDLEAAMIWAAARGVEIGRWRLRGAWRRRAVWPAWRL